MGALGSGMSALHLRWRAELARPRVQRFSRVPWRPSFAAMLGAGCHAGRRLPPCWAPGAMAAVVCRHAGRRVPWRPLFAAMLRR